MKYRFGFATALAALTVVVVAAWARAAGPPAPDTSLIRERLGEIHRASLSREAAMTFAQYRDRAAWMAQRADRFTNSVRVTHTHVEFSADGGAGTVDALSTLTVESRQDDVDEIELLTQKLETFSVADGADNPLTYVYDPSTQVLVVQLDAALGDGDTMTIEVRNAGDPQCAPDDFFGMEFCHVGDDVVYFTGLDFVPIAAPYDMADLYAGGPVDLDITTPPGWTAATTSDLDDVDEGADEWVHHFVGHFDTTYGGLAAADFTNYSASTDNTVPVWAHVHSGTQDFGQHWADTAADIIAHFSAWFSMYLYNKHDIIQTRDELGGGVGPQSATFYYASALNTDPQNFTSESIYSHEIGHQWWGNMVRLGDNYAPWLNEGFAEYSSRRYGYQVWPEYYQDYLYDFYFLYFLYAIAENEVPMSGAALYSGDSLAYQAATYWKGSHLLRMLEWLLGDDAFMDAMRVYAETYRSDMTDELVTMPAFQAVLEEQTGENMDDFFAEWTTTVGFPIYRYAAEFDGNSARVRIEQTQPGAFFSIPVPVSIWVGEEDEPRTERMTFDENGVADQTFAYDAAPRGASVDPRDFIWGDKVPALSGDVDSSNEVDGIDLIYMGWSQGGSVFGGEDSWNFISECDFDRDGDVDADDLAVTYPNFGKEGRIDD